MLSRVAFSAYLAYSPRGTSDLSRRSRVIRDAVKAGREDILTEAVSRLERNLTVDMGAFFGPDVVLVPAPRSSPLVAGGLWPPLKIAATLRNKFGGDVIPCLVRTEAVPKSAFAKQGERPSVSRPYESMAVTPMLDRPRQILLVDDFVTLGRTLLAGASRLAEAFPDVEIRTFALIRTMGLIPEVEAIEAPCVGEITYRHGAAHREP